jgi:c-di-GMP-binding flagellar brake protein YcgR
MPDYTDAKQSALSDLDEADRFVVQNSSEIRLQLITLARQPDIITAYYNDGKAYLLTAVLGVLDERGLLVLDYGPDDAITKKAIASGRLVCTTKHDGVPIRFSCEGLQSARFKGLPAIATPIPGNLYRMQRREFYRVQTPKINGPRCEIPDTDGGLPHQLTISDLCAAGAGMLDISGRLQVELEQRFENCSLFLPEHNEIRTSLVVRNIGKVTPPGGEPIPRYGFSFEGLSAGDSAELQRYIFQLQAQQPK